MKSRHLNPSIITIAKNLFWDLKRHKQTTTISREMCVEAFTKTKSSYCLTDPKGKWSGRISDLIVVCHGLKHPNKEKTKCWKDDWWLICSHLNLEPLSTKDREVVVSCSSKLVAKCYLLLPQIHEFSPPVI